MSVKWIQSEQAHQQRSVSLTAARLGGRRLRKKKAIIIKSNDNDNDKRRQRDENSPSV
jgi:hypothetical protein